MYEMWALSTVHMKYIFITRSDALLLLLCYESWSIDRIYCMVTLLMLVFSIYLAQNMLISIHAFKQRSTVYSIWWRIFLYKKIGDALARAIGLFYKLFQI